MLKELLTVGVLLGLAPAALRGQSASGYSITTVAGGSLGDGGPAAAATIWSAEKAITDAAGNLYIAETDGHRIRRVTPSGVISTWAGTGTAGFSGDGGPAAAAQLNRPVGLAVDAQGSLYVADSGNNRVRRISPQGVISTFVDGSLNPDLRSPRGLAFDMDGNLLISFAGSGILVRRSPAGGLSAVLAGLSSPGGLAVDAQGNIYVANTGRHVVVKMPRGGEAVIFAGTDSSPGYGGDRGPAAGPAARLSSPADVAVDNTGAVYIADRGNRRIRKVARVGTEDYLFTEVGPGPATVPPSGSQYTGDPVQAPLSSPRGVWIDAAGSLYITDSETGFGMVRKVEGGSIRTVAGGDRGRGDGGPAVAASLYEPRNVALDAFGELLIADTGSHRVRRVTAGGAITGVAGAGLPGIAGDGGPARTAWLSSPVGLAADASGNIYIGDTGNARLRQMRPSGDIITIAGTGLAGNSGDGAGATLAQLRDVQGIALDAAGNIYLADTGNHRIRKITRDGVIQRIAGTSSAGAGGDGPDALQSAINSPRGVAVAADGTVYFSDSGNHRIRRILPNGAIETVAGTGLAGYSGDGGAARSARFNSPAGLAVDAEGNLFVADTNNHSIRHIAPGGFVRTIAGTGRAGFSGDQGAAISAQLSGPTGLALDGRGNIYVADRGNHRIRKLSIDVASGRLSIAGGDRQSGAPGARLPAPLAVRVTNLTGAAMSGVRVSFAVTRGTAQLSAASVVTGADGVASVSVTLGSTPGEVLVVASAPGLLSVQFSLTVEGAVAAGRPRIFAGGIVGAGASIPAIRHLAPNGLYTIYGENFAQPGAGWQVGAADLVNGQVPVRFQGVCVEVGGTPAPVIYVGSGQINFQALRATGYQPVQVVLNCRSASEIRSNQEYVEFRAASPEFFYAALNQDGRNPVAAVDALTGAVIGSGGVKPGDYVTAFGTGFGVTIPEIFAGELASQAAPVTGSVSLTLGGRPVEGSELLYVGATPGYAGLYQVNFRVPGDAGEGDLPLVITIGGIPSPEGAYLKVVR